MTDTPGPMAADLDGLELEAWDYVDNLYPDTASADLDYSADEVMAAYVAGALARRAVGGGGEIEAELVERLCVAMQDGVGCTPWESRVWDRDDGVSRELVRDSIRRALAAHQSTEQTDG